MDRGSCPYSVARKRFCDAHGGRDASDVEFYRVTHKRKSGDIIEKAQKHMENMEAYIQNFPVETRGSEEVAEKTFMAEFRHWDGHGIAFQAGIGVKPLKVRSKAFLSSYNRSEQAKLVEEREAERRRLFEAGLRKRLEADFNLRLQVKVQNNDTSDDDDVQGDDLGLE